MINKIIDTRLLAEMVAYAPYSPKDFFTPALEDIHAGYELEFHGHNMHDEKYVNL